MTIMISKIILGLCLLAAVSSKNSRSNGDFKSIFKQLFQRSTSNLTGSSPVLNIEQVVIVVPMAPCANTKENSHNKELASIVRLLKLPRESSAGLPSPAGVPSMPMVSSPPNASTSLSVSSPPNVPSRRTIHTENKDLSSRNKTLASDGVPCSTNGVTGVCMELRKCPFALQAIQNGNTLQFCGSTGSEPIVCCTLLSTTTSTATTTINRATPETVITTTKSYNESITDNEVASKPVKTETERAGCGWNHPRDSQNGTNDGQALHGEFPWMCAVLRIITRTNKTTGEVRTKDLFERNGVLVQPSVVLVGRYLPSDGRYRVSTGAGSFSRAASGQQYQLRDVATVEMIGRFPFSYYSVLILNAPMTLTPNVAVACLPPQGQRVPPGTTCVATWWDHEKDVEYNHEAKLKKMEVSVMERASCDREMMEAGLYKEGYILPSEYSCVTVNNTERTDSRITCEAMSRYSSLFCATESIGDRYILSGFIWNSYNCHIHPFWPYVHVTAKGYDIKKYSVDSH